MGTTKIVEIYNDPTDAKFGVSIPVYDDPEAVVNKRNTMFSIVPVEPANDEAPSVEYPISIDDAEELGVLLKKWFDSVEGLKDADATTKLRSVMTTVAGIGFGTMFSPTAQASLLQRADIQSKLVARLKSDREHHAKGRGESFFRLALDPMALSSFLADAEEEYGPYGLYDLHRNRMELLVALYVSTVAQVWTKSHISGYLQEANDQVESTNEVLDGLGI